MPRHSQGGYRQRDNFTGQVFGSSARVVIVGKPDSAFTRGILSAPDNVVSVWRGPAHSGDADTGSNLTVHYATQDCETADYVVCEKIGGKWYVSPLECV